MQVTHLISKTAMKTAAGKLWTIPLMDAALAGWFARWRHSL